MALGKIDSLKDGRTAVKNSFPISIYEPDGDASWDEAYEEFKKYAKLK